MRVTRPGRPSPRLAGLVAGDLSGHERDTMAVGQVRFVPVGGGPVLELGSRIERRFLGRTEVAVFLVDLDRAARDESILAIKHTGGLKRTGVSAVVEEGGEAGHRLASALSSDSRLVQALMPLDFTRFQLFSGPDGCRCEVELMGASHVGIALPPIRSYVHLYPDQRKAMISGIEAVSRVARAIGN